MKSDIYNGGLTPEFEILCRNMNFVFGKDYKSRKWGGECLVINKKGEVVIQHYYAQKRNSNIISYYFVGEKVRTVDMSNPEDVKEFVKLLIKR